MQYPIIGIVGRRGYGKTAFATAMALESFADGYKVIANYKLDIDHIEMTLAELADLPDEVHDCVVIMDEFHMGADAYDFFTKRARSLTKFITQLRKRRVTFIYTTQYIQQIAKRIREQTDYIIMMRPVPPSKSGIFDAFVRDPHLPYVEQIINHIRADLREVFPFYDTSEIIDISKNEDENDLGTELDDEMIEIFQEQGA